MSKTVTYWNNDAEVGEGAPLLTAQTIAHEDAAGQLYMVSITAGESAVTEAPPLKVALVLDRSGSMEGGKLVSAKQASIEFVRSLDLSDRIAVFAFDDQVNRLWRLDAPHEDLVARISALETGGSTALYDGWLAGAKAVGEGGRVLLLSDGQANCGRYTRAHELAKQAEITADRYRVTTSTIGLGMDYDEALMAKMARAGKGAHYFAQTPEAMKAIFSQERLSVGSAAMEHVELVLGGVRKSIGHLWAGETKNVLIEVADPTAVLEIHFRLPGGNRTQRVTLDHPTEFEHSHEVTLERLIERASDLEENAIRVRDERSAQASIEALRTLSLALLSHPLADEPLAIAVRTRLEAAIARLQNLATQYDESAASAHRKRSLQSSFNMRERNQAYSAFEDEARDVHIFAEASAPMRAAPEAPLSISDLDGEIFTRVTIEQWRSWTAVPIARRGRRTLLLTDPKDGFLVAEIGKAVGRKLRAEMKFPSRQEILDLLAEAERTIPTSQ